jgi:hypothetical protein
MGFSTLDFKLQKIADALDKAMPDLLATQILIETSALHKKRIFDEGKRTDGTDIGEYSTEEGYYSKDRFIRKAAFKPRGKRGFKGERIVADGDNFRVEKKIPKTMYLADGYSEFRSIQGRKVNKINLKYSGSLEGNLTVLKDGNDVLYGTTDQTESDKFNALQEEYEVFEFNTAEHEYLNNEITKAAQDIATTN